MDRPENFCGTRCVACGGGGVSMCVESLLSRAETAEEGAEKAEKELESALQSLLLTECKCGKENAFKFVGVNDKWLVECGECGLSYELGDTREEAARIWNEERYAGGKEKTLPYCTGTERDEYSENARRAKDRTNPTRRRVRANFGGDGMKRYSITPEIDGVNLSEGGEWCKSSDVTALESKHAALLEVAGKMATHIRNNAGGIYWNCPFCGNEQEGDALNLGANHAKCCLFAAYREVVK